MAHHRIQPAPKLTMVGLNNADIPTTTISRSRYTAQAKQAADQQKEKQDKKEAISVSVAQKTRAARNRRLPIVPDPIIITISDDDTGTFFVLRRFRILITSIVFFQTRARAVNP